MNFVGLFTSTRLIKEGGSDPPPLQKSHCDLNLVGLKNSVSTELLL